MGTFNNDDIKLLNTAGITADIDKEYSKEEKKHYVYANYRIYNESQL